MSSTPGPAGPEPPTPRVSVVVPTLNVATTLAELLDALAGESVPGAFEVIVADNGSTDGTVELARSYSARLDLKVIDASARPGAGAARNAAVAHARADLLVMLDGDDVPSPGYLDAMARGLELHDLVGSATDPLPIGSDAAAPGGTPLFHGTDELRSGYLRWTSTSNMGIRRAAIDRVGGFDEELRFGNEDQDLCWRVQLAGGTIGFVPDAVLRCHLPSSQWAGIRTGVHRGRADSQMARKWARHGQSPVPVGSVLRQLLGTCQRCLRSRDPHDRWRWGLLFGRNLGRLYDRLRPVHVSPVPGIE